MILNKKNIGKLLFYEFLFILFFLVIIQIFHLPSYISYGIDIVNIFVLLYMVANRNTMFRICSNHLNSIFISVMVLWGACFFTAVINQVSPLLFIWSTRNSFRFFVPFFAIIIYWQRKDLIRLIKILNVLQVVNFLLILVQFFLLDYSQDQLGGIFGNEVGCNGYLNIFLCVTVPLVLELYLHGKVKLWYLFYTIFSWMIIAAMAELKVAFLELAFIVFLSIVLSRPSKKTVCILVASIMGLVIGINVIIIVFPSWARAFADVGALIKIGKETGGGYNISRTTAFSDINKLFFKNSIIKNIFGYGFGSCEYSSFDFFLSAFYKEYGYLNYRWFSHQMWFLQCGYSGIVAYLFLFLTIFIWFWRMKNRIGDDYGLANYGEILVALCVVNGIYNATLITEIGYIAFICLTIPFLYYKCERFENDTSQLIGKELKQAMYCKKKSI
ncbi:MAG: hypothetical protein Q4A04_01035 [Eubacteriales bacterium]|nr:hypothetical protein [Eubacteriales bacterium]